MKRMTAIDMMQESLFNAKCAWFHAQHLPDQCARLQIRMWELLFDWAYIKDLLKTQNVLKEQA
jgi:hypothetical protein